MSEQGVVVIKIGSNALLDERHRLDLSFMDMMAGQIAGVAKRGWTPVLVSSGAVACGMALLGIDEKPETLPERQALAATGQATLVHRWQVALEGHGLKGGQLLLTAEDFSNRARYLNLTAAFRAMVGFGVVPIVNENDTVSVNELALGDNDRLSALVASQMGASRLILLTDIDGYYDADPRTNPKAKRISQVTNVTKAILSKAGGGGRLGTGGMHSKLEAARLAASSGVVTTITNAREPDALARILGGEDIGTTVAARVDERPSSRRRWLAFARRSSGTLHVDAGAEGALKDKGRSLLPVGIKAVDGSFRRGDTVTIADTNGEEIARGLVSLSSQEISKICGQRMEEATDTLGYPLPKAVVHRDNLVLR